jgi:hypothetical protein
VKRKLVSLHARRGDDALVRPGGGEDASEQAIASRPH